MAASARFSDPDGESGSWATPRSADASAKRAVAAGAMAAGRAPKATAAWGEVDDDHGGDDDEASTAAAAIDEQSGANDDSIRPPAVGWSVQLDHKFPYVPVQGDVQK